MSSRYLIWPLLGSAVFGCTMPGTFPSSRNQTSTLVRQQSAYGAKITPDQWAGEFRRIAAVLPLEYAPVVATQTVSVEDQPGEPPAAFPVVRITFPDRVFFEFAADMPRSQAGPMLDAIAAYLNRSVPNTTMTVVGHTDAIGSDTYNIDLSRRRAFGVMRALVIRGVDPRMLSTVAVGKQQPVASNDTEEGRAKNRRVEFVVSGNLAANLTSVQYTASDPNAVANIYSLQPAGNNLDLALNGSLPLSPTLTAKPQAVAPASLQVQDPTPGDPSGPTARSPDAGGSAALALPSSRRATPSAAVRASATTGPAIARRPAPEPRYEPKVLEPGVQIAPLGPAIPFN